MIWRFKHVRLAFVVVSIIVLGCSGHVVCLIEPPECTTTMPLLALDHIQHTHQPHQQYEKPDDAEHGGSVVSGALEILKIVA